MVDKVHTWDFLVQSNTIYVQDSTKAAELKLVALLVPILDLEANHPFPLTC
jgi:hypothetical protein